MDGRGGYDLHAPFYPHTVLRVSFRPADHARVPHADETVEHRAAAAWVHASTANPTMFNQSKFRYARCLVEETGRDGAAVLTLDLGLTDYATFQGTHAMENALEIFGEHGLARPLGNAVVVETCDGWIPFLTRSQTAGEGAGAVVIPGGHPEPSVVGISDNDGDFGVAEGGDDAVAREMWDAARREVVEELFIPDSALSTRTEMRCLGVVSRNRDAKALVAFWAGLGMTAAEVECAYRAGNSNCEESTRIEFVSIDQLQAVLASGQVGGRPVMPDHAGAVDLACQYYQWRRNDVIAKGDSSISRLRTAFLSSSL
jgi:8-oxo-dGTP pyrophosphatase MutT (NUDIX family)